MDRFPTLKSGAVLQYGSAYTQQYHTDILTYIDGKEQRVPTRRTRTLTWRVRLQELSLAEANDILEFFHLQRGRAGTFLFLDP